MPIHVGCQCGKSFDVREEFAGRQLACTCGRVLVVPLLAPPRPVPTPVARPPQTPAASSPPPQRGSSSLAPIIVTVCILLVLAGGAAVILLNLDDLKGAGEGGDKNAKAAEKS